MPDFSPTRWEAAAEAFRLVAKTVEPGLRRAVNREPKGKQIAMIPRP